MAYTPVVLSDEKLAELEAEHEDILVLRGSDRAPWVVVIRRPTRQETIGYKQHAKNNRETSAEALIRRVCVFPTGEALEAQINRWPFFCDGAVESKAFSDFVGVSTEEQVKK